MTSLQWISETGKCCDHRQGICRAYAAISTVKVLLICQSRAICRDQQDKGKVNKKQSEISGFGLK